MQNRILLIIGVVVLLLVSWNTWTVSQLSSRVSAWEQATNTGSDQGEAVATTKATERYNASQFGPRAGTLKNRRAPIRKSNLGEESEAAALDIENPEVREAIEKIVADGETKRKETKRKEQIDAYLDSMVREVDTFSEDYNLDAATKAKLMRELESRAHAWTAVKNDVQDGVISWIDAKEEFRVLKEEGETSLTELLGTEKYEDLRSRLWGHRGGK